MTRWIHISDLQLGLGRDTIAPLLDHCPILSVVGNHDHTLPDLRTDLFCRYNGRDGMSSFYSDTFDGVQVICVDETLRFDEERGDPGRLLPLLLQHEVDLYLCGHMHIYERARYQSLTQVQAGASRMAYEGLLEMVPSRHLQAQDEHQSYVVFEIRENRIEARAIALGGDPIDAWVQPLNRPMANDRT